MEDDRDKNDRQGGGVLEGFFRCIIEAISEMFN